jgi:hypothetical protein
VVDGGYSNVDYVTKLEADEHARAVEKGQHS